MIDFTDAMSASVFGRPVLPAFLLRPGIAARHGRGLPFGQPEARRPAATRGPRGAPGCDPQHRLGGHQPIALRGHVPQGRHPGTAVRVHLDLGRVFESQGNHEGALLEYQEALAPASRRG